MSFKTDNRLESVANVHTAADLHARPGSQIALILRIFDTANAQRDTSCPLSRNENDSPWGPAKTASRPQNQAARFAESGKLLNLRTDSKCRAAVTFLTIAQNRFVICL
jgi:hypothetical protein